MRRRDKAVKTQHRKMLKSRNTARVARRRKPSAVDAYEKIARLEHRLNETLEQQSATTEVLRVIASSPTEIQSVLDAITTTAARLLDVADAYIMRVEGQLLRAVSMHGPSPQWSIGTTRAINRNWVTGRAVVDRKPVRVRDLQAARSEFPEGAAYAKQYGHRTTLATPLLREGKPIGAFLIRRNEVSRSPLSRSSCCKISPLKRSSPLRIRACSTSCASALMTFPNRWSSKPPRRKCCA
jgi:transcriptional regulator with GAF, ATPase, and Fis domain